MELINQLLFLFRIPRCIQYKLILYAAWCIFLTQPFIIVFFSKNLFQLGFIFALRAVYVHTENVFLQIEIFFFSF